MFGFTVKLRLKFPPPKVLFVTGLHRLRARATLVLDFTVYEKPAVPLVPVRVRVVPERLIWVMPGCDGATTWAIIVPSTLRLLVHVRPGAEGSVTLLKLAAL